MSSSASRTRAIGVPNPAKFFDASDATTRLGPLHRGARRHAGPFSFGGPNDSFNRREQRTWTIGDTLSWTRARTRCGSAASSGAARSTRTCRRNRRRSSRSSTISRSCCAASRPRATRSSASPTSGSASMTSTSSSPTTGSVGATLTLNSGRALRVLRVGRPKLNGRIGNVDFEALTNSENPVERVHRAEQRAEHRLRGDRRGDRRVARAGNKHTLKGQDWNNFAPRVGLRLGARRTKWVVRGGYGIFYDRPSAAFINTVFSNYPFLREQ